MNIASLDLSKTLYELSHWQETYFWLDDMSGGVTSLLTTEQVQQRWRKGDAVPSCYPAYDLGYLMRKLKQEDVYISNHHTKGWSATCLYEDSVQADVEADTPEDAACKLAIELFKQGVLTKQQS